MLGLLTGLALAVDLDGAVTGPDGPVEGARVVAYDPRLAYAYTETDADGRWSLADLPASVLGEGYRLRVLAPPDVNLVEAWAGGVDVCSAPPQVAGPVDVELSVGGVLSGVLEHTDGAPAEGAAVIARYPGSVLGQERYTWADADGRFSVQGLPSSASGWAVDVQRSGWPGQYLGPAYSLAEASTYAVSPGDELDLGTHVLLDGISASGEVTGPDGPLAEGYVMAYTPSQVVTVPVVDGAWEAWGLPPGELLVWVESEGYATTWWPDADRPGDRVPVLEEGEHADGVDVEVPYEARLRARLDAGGDLSGVTVLAWNDTHTVGRGAQADVDGTVVVDKLHGGDWTLYVWAADEGLISDYVRGDDGEPVVFSVPDEGDTPVHDLELPAGARIDAVVTDCATGEPLYGASVAAVGLGTGEGEAASADREGLASMTGLLADDWMLQVAYEPICPGDRAWAPRHWPDARSDDDAEPVELTAGDTLTWELCLEPDDDRDGMADAWEEEVGLDPSADDSTGDPDGDGWSNLEEYWLDTDPFDPRGCGCSGGRNVMILPVLGLLLLAGRRRRGEGTHASA